MKNLLFLSLLSCASITIIASDNAASRQAFEKFKQQCPDSLEQEGIITTIDKSTLEYDGPCTKENCKGMCNDHNLSLLILTGKSTYTYCKAITYSTAYGTQKLKCSQRIAFDDQTSKIVGINMINWFY